MKSIPKYENRFSVLYRIRAESGRKAEANARDAALEQTVELPESCVPEGYIKDEVMGRVESVTEAVGKKGYYDATISYHCDTTGYQMPQFINVLFGNISMKNNIRLMDMSLPDSFLANFSGPRYGIDGLRKLLGVTDRPIACTALKPMGANVEELAKMADGFVRGGGDIIKDDHGLANQPYHPFEERIVRCQEAVEQANEATGNNCIYCPMISGPFDRIEGQVRYAKRNGVKGVLVPPVLVGFDTARYIAETYKLVVIGHPALSGVFFGNPDHGITPAILLGTIYRMLGVDISIFVNYGGRFQYTREECLELCDALRKPLADMKPAFPSPSGGMNIDNVREMTSTYGKDTVFLISGGLIGYNPDMETSTRAFMDAIRA